MKYSDFSGMKEFMNFVLYVETKRDKVSRITMRGGAVITATNIREI